jgi:hypothetical protein
MGSISTFIAANLIPSKADGQLQDAENFTWPELFGESELKFVSTSSGGKFNNKGTKERRILF